MIRAVIIDDEIKRTIIADGLYNFVMKNHSEKSVIQNFINWVNK